MDADPSRTTDRGQGLNNALQDASNFVGAIKEVASGAKGLPEAISAYDAEVLERGIKEMKVSLAQTTLIHDWNTLMQSPMVTMGMRRQAEEAAKSS